MWFEFGSFHGIPTLCPKLIEKDSGSLREVGVGDVVPFVLPFSITVPRGADRAGRLPTGGLGNEGFADFVHTVLEGRGGASGSQESVVEEVFVNAITEVDPEIAVVHQGPKDSVGRVLVEIVCVDIVEHDVAVPREELPATFAGVFWSGSHPVVLGGPVPIVAAVVVKELVVGEALPIDPVFRGLSAGGCGCFYGVPCGAPGVSVIVIAAGAAGIGVMIVLGVSSEVFVHVVMHGALVKVIKTVISAIDIAVDVATMQRGVAHDHFHVAHPAIANVEGIAGTVGPVGLVGGNGHPIKVIVGTAAELQEVELIIVCFGAIRFLCENGIAEF